MASSVDVQVVPEPSVEVQQAVVVEACDGGSRSPETTTTTKKEESSVMTTVPQEQRHDTPPDQPGHHEDDAAAPHKPAAEVPAWSEEPGEEKKKPAPKEDDADDGDHQQDSTRDRLKRHRQEVAGRVWVPEMWGQEKLLKDWVDCAVFDQPLVPAGLLTARRALVAESCTTRRPDRTSTTVTSAAGSGPLRVRRTGAPNRSGAQSLLPPAATTSS